MPSGNGDAEDLLRIAFRLDQHGGDHRHARFDAAVLAGEADLLGTGILALEAELGPGREDELRLTALRRLLGRGRRRRRRLLLRLGFGLRGRVLGAGGVWAISDDQAATISIVVASANANAQATGRAGANAVRWSIVGPLAYRSRSTRASTSGRPQNRLCRHQIRQERDALPLALIAENQRPDKALRQAGRILVITPLAGFRKRVTAQACRIDRDSSSLGRAVQGPSSTACRQAASSAPP